MKRYYITAQQHDEIKKRDFSCDTFTNGKKKYKCYSDTMLYLLSDNPEMQNMETKQVEKVEKDDINHFLNIYESAFDRGVDQFNSDYKIDASVLYSTNTDAFVKTLIEKFYEPYTGWKWESEMLECVVTYTNIEKIGHASGSRSAFRELVNKHKAIFEKYEKETNNFDSDDTTNPLIFEMDLITGLHNNFRSFIFETTDIDTFKNYFRERPMPIKKRKGITISELCYLFGKIERNKKGVSNFAKWMKNHIEGNNYGSKKNELIDLAKNAKERRNGFPLTAPQQKALENKEKIDNKIKLMQID